MPQYFIRLAQIRTHTCHKYENNTKQNPIRTDLTSTKKHANNLFQKVHRNQLILFLRNIEIQNSFHIKTLDFYKIIKYIFES